MVRDRCAGHKRSQLGRATVMSVHLGWSKEGEAEEFGEIQGEPMGMTD